VFRDLERRLIRAPLGWVRPGPEAHLTRAQRWEFYGTPEAQALRYKIGREYKPEPYAGTITVFLAAGNQHGGNEARRLDWRRLAQGGYREVLTDGDHMTWTKPPHVERLAAALLDVLEAARSADA
jgi:thioesterase domain-containing protein